MVDLFVGFLIGSVGMWFVGRALLRDTRKKWETERAYLKYLKDEEQLAVRGCHLMLKTAARLRQELREENERLRAVEAAAREVVKLADEEPWDPAMNAFWHAVDRLGEELKREQ